MGDTAALISKDGRIGEQAALHAHDAAGTLHAEGPRPPPPPLPPPVPPSPPPAPLSAQLRHKNLVFIKLFEVI